MTFFRDGRQFFNRRCGAKSITTRLRVRNWNFLIEPGRLLEQNGVPPQRSSNFCTNEAKKDAP